MVLILTYLSVFLVSPPLYVNNYARLLAILFSVLAFTKFRNLNKLNAVSILFVITLITNLILNNKLHLVKQHFALMIFVMMMNLLFHVIKKDSEILRIPVIATLIVTPIWNTLTLIEFTRIPNLARLLAGNGLADEFYYASRGVAGYGLVYSVVLIPVAIITFASIDRQSSKKMRLLFVVNVSSAVLVLIKAGYFIAILSFLISVCIYLLSKLKKNRLQFFSVALLVIILFVSFGNSVEGILLDITEDTMFHNKIVSIFNSKNQGEMTGPLYERVVRYEKSIETFIENPISGNYYGAGGHSTLLDIFARFGIISGVLFVLQIYYFVKVIYSFKGQKIEALRDSLIFYFLFIMILNNISFSMGTLFFVVVPYIIISGGKLNALT